MLIEIIFNATYDVVHLNIYLLGSVGAKLLDMKFFLVFAENIVTYLFLAFNCKCFCVNVMFICGIKIISPKPKGKFRLT